ncbi:MAG TPA: hypothetical protein VHA80_04290 [Solirubrobacterales bacterium]|nr:hypothetical protein [Solirubrobacterales bacterium]
MTKTADTHAAQTRAMASQRVWATERAVDAIVHLRNQLGNNLMLRHVAGLEGAPEVRLETRGYPRGPDDVCLGTVGGVQFLIDRRHDVALGYPDFHVDVTPTRLDNDETGVRAQYHLVSRATPRLSSP